MEDPSFIPLFLLSFFLLVSSVFNGRLVILLFLFRVFRFKQKTILFFYGFLILNILLFLFNFLMSSVSNGKPYYYCFVSLSLLGSSVFTGRPSCYSSGFLGSSVSNGKPSVFLWFLFVINIINILLFLYFSDFLKFHISKSFQRVYMELLGIMKHYCAFKMLKF